LALATGRQTDQQLADKITYSGDLDHGRKVTSALNMMI
jgi:aspartate carbamoyltransferase catalytic subunit